MKILKELSEINSYLESVDNIQSGVQIQQFKNELAFRGLDPIAILQKIGMFSPALIAILNVVKLFTGEKADKKIDDLISTLRLLSIFKK